MMRWFISRLSGKHTHTPAWATTCPLVYITLGLPVALIALMTMMAPAQAQTPASATYTVTFQGNWTTDSTPGGVVSNAHFTTLVGAVHNDMVTFWESGGTATSGVEDVAELGITGDFESEVTAAGANASLVKQRIGSSPTVTATFDIEVTNDRPLFTLLSMIGPSPDWFVGVSGLSLLNNQNQWLSSREVNLFPYDAGTEDGSEFTLSNPATSPQGTITSIRGTGKFSNEPMAMLSFERQGTGNDTGGGGGGGGGTPTPPTSTPSFSNAPGNVKSHFNKSTLDSLILTLTWTAPEQDAENVTEYEYRIYEGSPVARVFPALIDWTLTGNVLEQDILLESDAKAFTVWLRAVTGTGRSRHAQKGVYVPDGIISVVLHSESELPDQVSLSQNYPNPFNPSTAIEYALSASAHVRLEVFDATGRRVETLADGMRPAGRHNVRFDAGGLPSGLYLYRLQAGGETIARNMTLIR